MNQFKIGQRVEGLNNGEHGTVLYVEGKEVLVRWDAEELDDEWCLASDLA